MPINDQWSVGAAVSAPFGFQTQWDNGWVGRYSALFSKLQSIDATFSVSYKVTDSLAVGGSLIAQRTSADLSNAVNFGTILSPAAAPAFLPQSADGYAELQAHNWKWGWQLGASWKPTDADTVAIDYHAEIKHHLNGQATFVVPPAVQGAFAQSPLTASLFTNTGGSTDYATPAFASLSYWHVFNDQFSAGADLDWTGWSNFKQLVVNFNNPGAAAVGRDIQLGGFVFLLDRRRLQADRPPDSPWWRGGRRHADLPAHPRPARAGCRASLAVAGSQLQGR